jgi:uncharacterized protein
MSVPKLLPETAVVLGLDLRSGPRYPTGLAVLDADRRLRQLAVVRTDEQIEAAIDGWRPALIAIDAPLALPEGRCCAETTCECARFGIFREIDRLCAALGYRPYPTLLPSMVGLTLRGSALAARLLERGERVLEVYPGMVQDILGIPRKQAGLPGLTLGLRRAEVRGIPRARRVTHDELDAVTCALAALLHLEGRTETLGSGIPVPFVFPIRNPLTV